MEANFSHTDNNLIIALQNGDEGAFSNLFRVFYAPLCIFGKNLTNDQGVSEHIAADSLMKLWERRSNFSHFPSLKSFLYTTVRNASIDWLRHTRGEKNRSYLLSESAKQNEKSSLELLITAETYRQLYSAINTLPSQCRDVINLSFIEGKKLKEVATELNIAVGTVKSQKSRALILLKKHLRALQSFFY